MGHISGVFRSAVPLLLLLLLLVVVVGILAGERFSEVMLVVVDGVLSGERTALLRRHQRRRRWRGVLLMPWRLLLLLLLPLPLLLPRACGGCVCVAAVCVRCARGRGAHTDEVRAPSL